MPTKITLIFDNPEDPVDFETFYPAQVGQAAGIAGVQKLETSKVWPKEDGSPTPAYRLLDIYFADYDAASRSVRTDEAKAFFANIIGLASGRVRIVFAEIEES